MPRLPRAVGEGDAAAGQRGDNQATRERGLEEVFDGILGALPRQHPAERLVLILTQAKPVAQARRGGRGGRGGALRLHGIEHATQRAQSALAEAKGTRRQRHAIGHLGVGVGLGLSRATAGEDKGGEQALGAAIALTLSSLVEGGRAGARLDAQHNRIPAQACLAVEGLVQARHVRTHLEQMARRVREGGRSGRALCIFGGHHLTADGPACDGKLLRASHGDLLGGEANFGLYDSGAGRCWQCIGSVGTAQCTGWRRGDSSLGVRPHAKLIGLLRLEALLALGLDLFGLDSEDALLEGLVLVVFITILISCIEIACGCREGPLLTRLAGH